MSTTFLLPKVKELEIPCKQRMEINIKQKQARVSLCTIYEYTLYMFSICIVLHYFEKFGGINLASSYSFVCRVQITNYRVIALGLASG